MSKNELNYYQSVKQPQVSRNVSVEWVLDEIKRGLLYKREIEAARAIGKGNDGYDEIKKNLPCVTWNFLFNKYKKDQNILSSTGYLYLDLDIPGFELANTDTSKIFCCGKSLSGKGSFAVVRVTGVTPINFKTTYSSIAEQLGLLPLIDINAIKKTQFNILSYDPGLFVNESSFVFNSVEPEVEKVSNTLNLSHINKGKDIRLNDTFVRYSNMDDYVGKDEIYIDRQGFELIRLFLPKTIGNGVRHHTLIAWTNNFVWLNPHLNFEQVFSNVLKSNNERCSEPLSESEIRKIVNSVFKYKKNNTLKPISGQNQKIAFGKDCKVEKKERDKLIAQIVGEWRKEDNEQAMIDTIVARPGKKTTQNTVAKITGLGIATVKRHWSKVSELAKLMRTNTVLSEEERWKLHEEELLEIESAANEEAFLSPAERERSLQFSIEYFGWS